MSTVPVYQHQQYQYQYPQQQQDIYQTRIQYPAAPALVSGTSTTPPVKHRSQKGRTDSTPSKDANRKSATESKQRHSGRKDSESGVKKMDDRSKQAEHDDDSDEDDNKRGHLIRRVKSSKTDGGASVKGKSKSSVTGKADKSGKTDLKRSSNTERVSKRKMDQKQKKATDLITRIRQAILCYEKQIPILKEQLTILSPQLLKLYPKIDDEFRRWVDTCKSGPLVVAGQKLNDRDCNHLLQVACVFDHVTALMVTRKRFFPDLKCYNKFGQPIVQIEKLITEGGCVKLFQGRFLDAKYSNGYCSLLPGQTVADKPIVIKLFESRDGRNTTEFEINKYRDIGSPSPSINVDCFLWNVPVLLMKPMEKLTPEDHENEVGIQILQQLPAMHALCTHSDIKPQNIMREPGVFTKEGKPQYRLIDFGGCPRRTFDNGFKRRTWTDKWTVQMNRKDKYTTPKHDLLELLETLVGLRFCRLSGDSRHPVPEKRFAKHRLFKFKKYVWGIREQEIDHKDYLPHYQALIGILEAPLTDEEEALEHKSRIVMDLNNSLTKDRSHTGHGHNASYSRDAGHSHGHGGSRDTGHSRDRGVHEYERETPSVSGGGRIHTGRGTRELRMLPH